MMIRSVFLTASLVLAFALPASAQSGDAAYCKALGDAYQSYAGGNTDRHATFGNNANVSVAIDKCSAGDTSGIPVLEKELKDAKIDLPKRG